MDKLNQPGDAGRPRHHVTLAAAGLAGLILAGLLTPIPFDGRTASAITDLAHTPLFAGLTFTALWLLDRYRLPAASRRSLVVRWLLVAIGLCGFGAMIELLQERFGRNASLGDVIANALGILVGTLWHRWWQLIRSRSTERLKPGFLLACSGFVLAIAWRPSFMTLGDIAAMHWNFPLLASFESRTELHRWDFGDSEGRLTRQDVTNGDLAMEVTFQPTGYPRATLMNMKSDWSAIQKLELDVMLDASYSRPTARFSISITDTRHDSDGGGVFQCEWLLKAGELRRICITRDELTKTDRTRALDLSAIHGVNLMLPEPGETTKVRFDRLRLTMQ